MTKRWSSPGSTFKRSSTENPRNTPQRQQTFQRQTMRDAERSRALDHELNTNGAALIRSIVGPTSKLQEGD